MIRSKKYLEAARDQSCVCCGSQDGTVVGCHYTGIRQHLFGKGRGIKCHDVCVADLCSKCHAKFDGMDVSKFASETGAGAGERNYMRKIDASEQFMYLVLQTLVRRIEQGLVEVA